MSAKSCAREERLGVRRALAGVALALLGGWSLACTSPGAAGPTSGTSEAATSELTSSAGAMTTVGETDEPWDSWPDVEELPWSFTDISELSPDLRTRPFMSALDWGGVDMYAPGVALVDLDGDGALDLFQAQSHRLNEGDRRLALYRGLGDGRFEEVAAPPWSGQNGVGALAFDYDRDDDLDLFVPVDGEGSVLLRNDGGMSFTDVTAEAGIDTSSRRAYTAAAADIDGDRDLDLYIGCANVGVEGEPNDDVPNILLENQGDGTFVDRSEQAGAPCRVGSTLGQGFADLDADGDLDLYVTNDYGADCLYENQGDGTFVDIAAAASVHDSAVHGMGVAFGDLDRNGWLDIFVTDDGGADASLGNAVFLNRGGWVFDSVGVAWGLDGIESPPLGWNVCWGVGLVDFDFDADLDIHVATHINRPELSWRNEQGVLTLDAVHDIPEYGVDARGSAYGDIDGDGDLDVVVARRGGAGLQLLRNDGPVYHHLAVAPRPLADAPGATVTITVEGREFIDVVQAGSSFMSTEPPEVVFGLGDRELVERVRVRFADGVVREFVDVAADQRVVVVHG